MLSHNLNTTPRFLVDIRWMKQWKKYVGYDLQDQSSAGEESANPGPLDNSRLFKGNLYTHTQTDRQTHTHTDGRLRDHLKDELDYYFLPESAWNKLSSWYGLSSGSKVIPR